jgi:hypothetical protein
LEILRKLWQGVASHAVETSLKDSVRLVKNSTLYKEFVAEREEILRHKWIESEKVGYDIGKGELGSNLNIQHDPK